MFASIAWLAFLLVPLLLEKQVGAAKAAKTQVSSAVVPRSKSAKRKGGIGDNPFFRNIMREIKISFSSELEGLTLQISRPNNAAVPLNLIGDLTNFANVEFDNPKLLINLLAKLARKFAEKNSFTQLKIILSLHSVMQKIDEPAKRGWHEAIESLRREEDERTNAKFFSSELVEDAAAAAESAHELEAAELNRLYLDYMLDFLHIRAESKPDPDELQRLLEHGEAVQAMANQAGTPLTAQLVEAIREDKIWLQGLLKAGKAEEAKPVPAAKKSTSSISSKADTTSAKASVKAAPADMNDAAANNKAFAALKGSIEKSVGLSSTPAIAVEKPAANINESKAAVDEPPTPPLASASVPKAASLSAMSPAATSQPTKEATKLDPDITKPAAAIQQNQTTKSKSAKPLTGKVASPASQPIGKKATGKITPTKAAAAQSTKKDTKSAPFKKASKSSKKSLLASFSSQSKKKSSK